MASNIFVNLPVRDVAKTKAFFAHLGFSHNPQFSNEVAVCIVIAPNIFGMMLSHEHFASFTKKPIADATAATEVIIALDCDSRQAVDEMVANAVEAGGSVYRDKDDHGWMYGHSFADPDGHQWEVLYMDTAAMPADMQGGAN